MGSYTPERAGSALAKFATTRARLEDGLEALAEVIDMDSAIRPLGRILKRRLARFVNEGYSPAINPQTGQFPDPETLVLLVAEMRQRGEIKEAHTVSRLIRDVRLLTVVARRMTVSQRLKDHDGRAS